MHDPKTQIKVLKNQVNQTQIGTTGTWIQMRNVYTSF